VKQIHVPTVNARYWTGIALASAFGTNLGDFYAHKSGLGLGPGLLVLAVLGGICFFAERRDASRHEAWYWLVIILIRTGATNIADYLAYRLTIPPAALAAGLCVLVVGLAWSTHYSTPRSDGGSDRGLPDSNAAYWLAMLAAGVLGTVVGDDCSDLFGQGPATVGLLVILLIAVVVAKNAPFRSAYWAVAAVAMAAGTAAGDFLAESGRLNLGLPLATLLTGLACALVLFAWRPGKAPRRFDHADAQEANL
jgi:uncharacterized membrane-anchored protein